jgi:hypothetical protein
MSGVDLREAMNWVLRDSPLLFVYFAGVVWALLTWSRHPGVSLLAALGLAILALTGIVWPFLYQIVPALYPADAVTGPSGLDEEPRGIVVFKLLGLVHSVVDAGAMLLVIFAVFSSRRPAERWAAPPALPAVEQR